MRISKSISDINTDRRISHHPIGTTRFACLDGEGVKGYTSPNDVEITFCITCKENITHSNRYWISLIGPYCRYCYFSLKECK